MAYMLLLLEGDLLSYINKACWVKKKQAKQIYPSDLNIVHLQSQHELNLANQLGIVPCFNYMFICLFRRSST